MQCILIGLFGAGAPVVAQNLFIQADTPSRYCSHGNRSKTALRARSSSGLEEVSSLRLAFLLSSEDRWYPREPVTVEPSPCPSKFQELAEPEPLETDIAFVSILHLRAVRELTISVRVLTFTRTCFLTLYRAPFLLPDRAIGGTHSHHDLHETAIRYRCNPAGYDESRNHHQQQPKSDLAFTMSSVAWSRTLATSAPTSSTRLEAKQAV